MLMAFVIPSAMLDRIYMYKLLVPKVTDWDIMLYIMRANFPTF